MTELSGSIVIVSRARPDALKRCLLGRIAVSAHRLGKADLPENPTVPFWRFPWHRRKSTLNSTRALRFVQEQAMAVDRVKNGENVTLMNLSRAVNYHQLKFTGDGIWVQSGGLYGKSVRSEPALGITTKARHGQKESVRIPNQRGLGDE